MQDISKDELVGLKDGGDLIVHTTDSTVYFFEESNYYVSRDSLYGKGYANFYGASEFKVVNKSVIAVKNIETIQQDELNLVKTGLLIGGILVVVIAGILILFPSSNTDSITITYSGN